MKYEVAWITDALSSKNIAREMTHYRIQNYEIRATDGRLTAGHPFPYDGEFLVPGSEFEKIVKKLPGTPKVTVSDERITLSAGGSRGTIKTLPIEQWNYPGVDDDGWDEVPDGLVQVLRDLIPFVSDNATQIWAMGIALYHGYAFATNNIALAGVRCDQLGEIQAILPLWAAEFVSDRAEGLVEWAWTDNYVAFRWENGAWMRAQLIDAIFPEQAIKMILSSQQGEASQPIDQSFRESFATAKELSDGLIIIGPTSIRGSFGEAQFEQGTELASLTGDTLWAARYLDPVIKVATHWHPASWPAPAIFRGERIFGLVVGRRS